MRLIQCGSFAATSSAHLSVCEFAAEIAATLAISATRSSDKVALLLFTDQVELFLPARKGRRHILRVIREMLFHEPKQRGTNIPAALAFLNHVIHRRAMVFLLTDFLHSHGLTVNGRGGSPVPAAGGASVPASRLVSSLTPPVDAATHGVTRPTSSSQRDVIQELGLTNSRHDLVCLHLHDPRESTIPNAGLLTIEDAETGELLEMDSARASVRERFARTNTERLAELDRALNRAGVETLRYNTADSFAQTLQRFFETRRGRRRG